MEVGALFLRQIRFVQRQIRTGHSIDIFDSNSQSRIREHPNGDQSRTESFILIIQGGFFGNFLLVDLRDGAGHSLLKGGVDVLLNCGFVLDDGCIRIFPLGR